MFKIAQNLATKLDLIPNVVHKTVKFMISLIKQSIEVGQEDQIEKWLLIDTLVAIRLSLKANDTQLYNYLVKFIDDEKDTAATSIYQNILDQIVSELMENGFIDLVDKSQEEIQGAISELV